MTQPTSQVIQKEIKITSSLIKLFNKRQTETVILNSFQAKMLLSILNDLNETNTFLGSFKSFDASVISIYIFHKDKFECAILKFFLNRKMTKSTHNSLLKSYHCFLVSSLKFDKKSQTQCSLV